MKESVKTIVIVGMFFVISAGLLVGLGNALLPLSFSFALAYFTFPMILRLEARGLKRSVSVIGIFAIISVLAIAIFILVVPALIDEAKVFFKELPKFANLAFGNFETLLNNFGFNFDLSSQGIKELFTEYATSISGDVFKSISQLMKSVFSNFFSALLVVLNLFLIPVFFYFLINDFEGISRQSKDLLPPAWRPKISHYVYQSNIVLSGYIRGQLLVAVILATLYAIGLSIVGVRFGLLIGISTGLLSIIPYAGSLLGFASAITISFANFTGFSNILGVLAVFAVVQGLEGIVITPRLVGNKVGLGVLPTMLAIIIGGNLFGFYGMIIAIPSAAILKLVVIDLLREYKSLRIYQGG